MSDDAHPVSDPLAESERLRRRSPKPSRPREHAGARVVRGGSEGKMGQGSGAEEGVVCAGTLRRTGDERPGLERRRLPCELRLDTSTNLVSGFGVGWRREASVSYTHLRAHETEADL
eukprot:477560-Rhodomonas_salina.2